ncbi:MAG: flagellar assembly protein FliW [Rhodospirillaceae bacterium]
MTTAAYTEETRHVPSAVDGAENGDERHVIETRFGPMEFPGSQALFMPRGILGFAEHRNFGIAYLPNRFIDRLMLLQSLSSPETSFLLLPLGIDDGIIAQDDLVSACNTMNVAPDNAVVAVIVTIRDAGGQPQVTVNLRAPILLDSETRTGWQYVLPNSKYSVRHTLALPQPAAPAAPAAATG